MKDNVQKVAAALVWDGDRFLICQRPAHKARGGLWEFPGGKLEAGESAQQALQREMMEELEAVTEVQELYMDVFHTYPDIQIELLLYHCRLQDPHLKLLEHQAIQWILPSEISQYDFCPADADILVQIQKDFASSAK